MLACMTSLSRWIPLIDFDQGSFVPLALVFQLTDELTPSDITDGFCKLVVFDHVLDSQTFDADHLVFANDACRKFVLVVTTLVVDTSMNTGDFEPGLLPVLGTFLFLGMPTLGFCKSFSPLRSNLGLSMFHQSRGYHGFDAKIKPNHCDYHWKGLMSSSTSMETK